MSSTCHLRPSCRWRGSEDLTVCCQAGTAEEALSEIPKCSPDLVITDMTMPGRGGLEFIKDVKAICPNLPVLVVSMHDEMLHAERALRAGARGYLMKEVDGEKMLEAIRRAGNRAGPPRRLRNSATGSLRCSALPGRNEWLRLR